MKYNYWLKNTFKLVSVVFIGILVFSTGIPLIPRTGQESPVMETEGLVTSIPSLRQFSEELRNGSDTLRGLFIDNTLALKVIQQPKNQAAYVSPDPDEATQFMMGSKFGSIGLLAHNYAGGSGFSRLQFGDRILLLYGNGKLETFQVTRVLEYQALDPKNVLSDFMDLKDGSLLSADELFMKVYSGKPHLTLQTCISAQGDESWGRLFVIAEPVKSEYN